MVVIRAVLVVLSVPLSLFLTYKLLYDFREFLFSEEETSPSPPSPPADRPHLSALAGDGDVRLTWSMSSNQLPDVQHWEYQQSRLGGTVAGMRSTGSSATSYLISGLTNGLTYSYRVRAALKQGGFGSWSNTVWATPMRDGNLIERLEGYARTVARQQEEMARQQGEMVRAQGRIAAAASTMVTLMTDSVEPLRQFADRGVGALEALAESSEETVAELGPIREALDHLATSGDQIANGLTRIEEKLVERPADAPTVGGFCGDGNDEPFAEILFAHGSSCMMEIDESVALDKERERVEQNQDRIRQVVEHLNQLREPALIFSVGYTTSVGPDVYNRQLSDTRATCVSRRIREGLDQPNRFVFRDVAKGEALVAHDPSGTSPKGRRVDLVLCESINDGDGKLQRKPVGGIADSIECSCP